MDELKGRERDSGDENTGIMILSHSDIIVIGAIHRLQPLSRRGAGEALNRLPDRAGECEGCSGGVEQYTQHRVSFWSQ